MLKTKCRFPAVMINLLLSFMQLLLAGCVGAEELEHSLHPPHLQYTALYICLAKTNRHWTFTCMPMKLRP